MRSNKTSYDLITEAFQELTMFRGSDDVNRLKRAYGLIGNAIQKVAQENVSK